MSAFVIGVPVPEGLDSKIYRVRVVVDRVDGAELTPTELSRIEGVYPSEPARSRTKRPSVPTKAKAARKSSRGRLKPGTS